MVAGCENVELKTPNDRLTSVEAGMVGRLMPAKVRSFAISRLAGDTLRSMSLASDGHVASSVPQQVELNILWTQVVADVKNSEYINTDLLCTLCEHSISPVSLLKV